MILQALREFCEFLSWDHGAVDEMVRVKILNENEAKLLHVFMRKHSC